MRSSVVRIILIVAIFMLMGLLIYKLLDVNMEISNKEKSSVSKEKTLVQLSWWGNDDRHKYTMEGVDYFQIQNPDIKVAYKYGVWNGYENQVNHSYTLFHPREHPGFLCLPLLFQLPVQRPFGY